MFYQSELKTKVSWSVKLIPMFDLSAVTVVERNFQTFRDPLLSLTLICSHSILSANEPLSYGH